MVYPEVMNSLFFVKNVCTIKHFFRIFLWDFWSLI